MENALGKLENTKTMSQTPKTNAFGKVPKALSLKMPKISAERPGYENPFGTRFTVFALAFNALGLGTLAFGGISIGGNVLAAEVVLGSSLVCLSAYLLRSIIGNRGKKN
jgi:hypothetical protein